MCKEGKKKKERKKKKRVKGSMVSDLLSYNANKYRLHPVQSHKYRPKSQISSKCHVVSALPIKDPSL